RGRMRGGEAMILAGDIGGTKTVLALFEPNGVGLRLVREQTYASQGYPTFDQILAEFLAGPGGLLPSAGLLGAAARRAARPRPRPTDAPGQPDEPAMPDSTGIPKINLPTDPEAAAYGMLHLRPDELVVLQQGSPDRPRGNIGVIAAGTGLGEVMLYWDGAQ